MDYHIKYGSTVEQDPKVVTLALAKANSNISLSDQDDLLNLLLDASVDDAERYIDSPLLEREIEMSISGWSNRIFLPISPIQSFTGIKYRDVDGIEQNLNPSDFRFDGVTKHIMFLLDTFPDVEKGNPFPIVLDFVAGYKEAEMPTAAKHAVLMRFSHKELYREDVPTSLNRAFYAALRPLRRWA